MEGFIADLIPKINYKNESMIDKTNKKEKC